MKAADVFYQNDGKVTTAYYQDLASRGPLGRIAVALFRTQKRSSRAKDYRRGKYRRAAYDVKTWSMQELCKELIENGAAFGITFGWKLDPNVVFGEDPSWVLYVNLPEGQVSFHNPNRGTGPDYTSEWDGVRGASESRIIRFCDSVPVPEESCQNANS